MTEAIDTIPPVRQPSRRDTDRPERDAPVPEHSVPASPSPHPHKGTLLDVHA